MKRFRNILLLLVVIGVAFVSTNYLISPLFKRLVVSSKKESIHSNADIESALVKLKQQPSSMSGSQIAFGIPRKPHKSFSWFINWKSAGIGSSQTESDRIISFSKVGDDMIVFSVPIRWQEDKSAGPIVSETETNISPALSGEEPYSTSPEEYERLKNYFASKTPDAALRCTIKRDASGRIVEDHEYFEGVLSLPQNQWAEFVSDFFKQTYGSTQLLYSEEMKLNFF